MSQLLTGQHLWDGLALTLGTLGRRLLLALRPRSAAAAVTRDRAEMVSLIFGVCTAIFLTKGLMAYRDLANAGTTPHVYDGSLFASLVRVWVCCAEDFAVGAACLLVGLLALRLAPSHDWRLGVRFLGHLAAAAALAYMVVNAQIFHVLRRYLTFSLFRLGGGFQVDRSISAYITLELQLALALVPLLTVAVHLWTLATFPRFWHAVAGYAARPLLLVPAAVGLIFVAEAAEAQLVRNAACDYARNPHLHFLRSLVWSSGGFTEAEVEDDVTDFLPGQPGHTPNRLARRPTNLIVITLESVSAAYFETCGCPLPTTPRLRELADRSLTFENHYATANHSIASALPILAGLYNDPTTLSTVIDHPTFPSPHASLWLQGLGYRTYFLCAGGKWAWEDYRNMVPAFCVSGYDVARDPTVPFWRGSKKPGAPLDDRYLDADLAADLLRAVRQERDNRFALFVWFYETHAPYYDGPGPEAWDEAHFPAAVRGNADKEKEFRLYLKALWRIDRYIGELYDELERLGLAEDTVIAVTGDHGEAFGEHGFFGHGEGVYEEEVRVPLILISPSLAPLGQRSRVLGSHVDLWATLTDLCGLPFDPRWQGRSLVSGGEEDRRAYFYRFEKAIGVREGKYKYIWDFREDRHLLFDLESDPAEKHDLAPAMPDYCARLHRRLKTWTAFQRQLTREHLAGK